VFVNGEKACSESPCRVNDLQGTALVKAVAKGFEASAEKAVAIVAGEDAIHPVMFSEDAKVKDTGMELPLRDKAFEVFVNGESRGKLPLKLIGLEPGQYALKFSGEGLASPVEKDVTVEKNRVRLIEPPSSDASSGDEDAAGDESEADEGHKPVATKVAALRPKRSRSRSVAKASQASTSTKASGGAAKLNFNSIPASTVVLNGKPLGRTPRMGITTKAGANLVVFIHPEKGRKRVSVSVPAGKTKTVAVRF